MSTTRGCEFELTSKITRQAVVGMKKKVGAVPSAHLVNVLDAAVEPAVEPIGDAIWWTLKDVCEQVAT